LSFDIADLLLSIQEYVLVIKMQVLRSAQRRLDTQRQIINHFSGLIPSFDDLFDECSWYTFFTLLTISSFGIAFILSRFLTVVDIDYDDRTRNKRTGRFCGVRRTRLF